jgi:multidrug efflux pump subunit AcrA (membrane-fusion protein)
MAESWRHTSSVTSGLAKENVVKRKKKVFAAAAVVVAAAGIGGYLLFGRGQSKADVVETVTATVQRGSVRQSVMCSGRVVSNFDVDIKCKASGQIIKLPSDVSDMVKKGDLLVELDPVNEQRVLHQAEVDFSASQARLVTARQNLAIAEQNLTTNEKLAKADLTSAQVRASDARAKADRMKQLLEKKLASQEECDTAETAAVGAAGDLTAAEVKLEELEAQRLGLEVKRQDVKLAEAAVESDTIDRTIAEDRLTDTKVVSTLDGVVANRNVQIGQIISSGISNVGGGTTVLTLSDLSRIFVLAAVDESDIGKVKEDQAAIITADAFPGRTFEGKVVQIAVRGVNSSNVVTFEVKIEVTSEHKSLLKPEMTANVEIVAAEKQDVLIVPVEAVTRKGRKFYATLAKGDDREVQTGLSDGLKMEIASGLAEGDTVVFRKGEGDSRWNAQQQDRNMRRGQRMFFGGGRR